MTDTTIDLAEPLEDPVLLMEQFLACKDKSERAAKLEREQKTRPLTKEESDFLAKMPEVYREAITLSRKLRRTNTGPARAKTPSKRVSKKATEQALIDDLLK
jgi:hypothetical protein